MAVKASQHAKDKSLSVGGNVPLDVSPQSPVRKPHGHARAHLPVLAHVNGSEDFGEDRDWGHHHEVDRRGRRRRAHWATNKRVLEMRGGD